jgi:hypothetical protein
MMKRFLPPLIFVVAVLHGCGERKVTTSEARSIADTRYMAHVKALGTNSAAIPQPMTEYRSDDTVFVYVEPASKKKITVIVDRSGKVADTIEPL